MKLDNMDARTSVIDKRLQKIKKIIAVASGKGGVGKSLVSSSLALNLVKKGYKVGLLDLDLYGPSSHIILGVKDYSFPEEKKGIIPHNIDDIYFMSIVYFTEDKPAPLRGIDITNIIIELLSITQWGKLDVLVIDMPPGIGDAVLDLIRLIKKIEFLIVTTSSKIAFNTVKKQIKLLRELKVKTIDVVENMKMNKLNIIKIETKKLGLRFLGEISYDRTLEDSLGDCDKLLATNFSKMVNNTLLKKEI